MHKIWKGELIQKSLIFLTITTMLVVVSFGLDKKLAQEKTLQHEDLVQATIQEKLATLNLPFIENQGQINEAVKYYASISGGSVFVTDDSLTYAVSQIENQAEKNPTSLQEAMERRGTQKYANFKTFAFKEKLFKDGQVATLNPKGERPSQAQSSYFQGQTQHANLPNYNFIDLQSPWENIGVSVKASSNNIEKLFRVDPQGDPNVITLGFEGIDQMQLEDNGELTLQNQDSHLTLTNPVAYQLDQAGNKKYVAVAYDLKDSNTYGFKVDDYDHSQALIIDPLIASTYFGGSLDEHYGYDNYGAQIYTGHPSMVQDASGNVYVIGHTKSGDYPTTLGVFDTTYNDASSILKNDIVISKFNPTLTTLLASTYLGGTSEDNGSAIQLDADGNVIVTGFTRSSDFPVTTNAYKTIYQGGNSDVFVAKFSSDLTTFIASTYIGGNNQEFAYAIVSDANEIYLVGDTSSSNFPTRAGGYDTTKGAQTDAFIVRLDSNLTTLEKTTFLGGDGSDYARAIKKDNAGNFIVAGNTTSADFPTTAGAYDQSSNSNLDGFVAILNPNLDTLNSATFLGGAYDDNIFSLATDSSSNIFVAGTTTSTDYPTTGGSYDTTHNGTYDGFIAKFNNSLTSLSASTFFGGSNWDDIYEIIVDSSDNIFVGGYTTSTLPTNNAKSGTADGFLASFNNSLATLSAATYIGGTSSLDGVLSLAETNDNRLLATGITSSIDFPTTNGAFSESNNGERDVFVTRLTKDLTINQTPHHIVVTTDADSSTLSTSAGTSNTLKITIKDNFGNTALSYTGTHNITLSGLANGTDGTVPTCTNSSGTAINFGSATSMTFTEGVAICNSYFYKNQVASIDATDGSVDSNGASTYDLDATVVPGSLSNAKTSIAAATSPISGQQTETITVTTKDSFSNPLTTGGHTVVLNVTGANSAAPAVIDNNNGTYTTTYIPTQMGNDAIAGTVDGNTIGQDSDPASPAPYDGSNGISHVVVADYGIHHFLVTYSGANSMTMLTTDSRTITITAKDDHNNTIASYAGSKNLVFSGANSSPYVNAPTCGGTNFGSNTALTFTAGVTTCALRLYNVENISVDVAAGAINSAGDASYDLDATVTVGVINHLKIEGSSTQTAGTSQTATITARDAYGNIQTAYVGAKSLTFSGPGASGAGNIPTATNSSSAPINFGTATSINFTTGSATTSMILYKEELVDVDVTNGTQSTTGSVNYDLGVNVSDTTIANENQTTISSSSNPMGNCGDIAIMVTAKDQYGNQLDSSSDTVVLSLTASSPNFGATVTMQSNGNGVYTGTYTGTNIGTDEIVGTINGNAIGADTDGTSDGHYFQQIVSGSNTLHWDGSTSTSWSDATNWTENQIPQVCTDVIIGDATTITNQPTVNVSGGSVTVKSIALGQTQSATLTLSNGSATKKLIATGDITIYGTGTLTHADNSTAQTHILNVEADNITIDIGGKIDVSGKGYDLNQGPGMGLPASSACGVMQGTGGSYGGIGGSTPNALGGVGYGSILSPDQIGSGGGGGAGGSGGGLVLLNITNQFVNNGSVLANGATSGVQSGGGSGGAIKITTNEISGSGVVNDNGGVGAGSSGGCGISKIGGGGAGGRVALYYANNTGFNLASNITAYGNTAGSQSGGAGTIYTSDTDTSGNNVLKVDNTSRNGGETPQSSGTNNLDISIDTLSIQNYGRYAVSAGSTLHLPIDTQYLGNATGYLTNEGTVTFPTSNYNLQNRNTFTNNAAILGDDLDLQNLTVTSSTFIHNASGTIDGSQSSGLNSLTLAGDATNSGYFEMKNFTTSISLIFDSVTINNYGVLTHTDNSTAQTHILNVEANNITINTGGKIDVSGKGYDLNQGPGAGPIANGACGVSQGNGGSYGGIGGSTPNASGGISYGLILSPDQIGSGGGGGAGGSGGGFVLLDITNQFVNNGSVLANGATSGVQSGGGSGGAIKITTNEISGSGVVNDNGGVGAGSSGGCGISLIGGGGAGGRIALYYANNAGFNLSSNITAYGNTAGSQSGGAGTIYTSDTDTSGNNVLKVDNTSRNGGETPQSSGTNNLDISIDTLSIQNYGRYTVSAGSTLHLPIDTQYLGNATGYLTNNGMVTFPTSNYNLQNRTTFTNNAAILGDSLDLQNLTVTSSTFIQDSGGTIDGSQSSGLNSLTLAGDATNSGYFEMKNFTTYISLIFDSVTINNYGVLTHSDNSTAQAHILNVEANNITINTGGKIDVSGKGYDASSGPGAGAANGGSPRKAAAGGGYGGMGGMSLTILGGNSYGSILLPTEMGSGGGAGYNAAGGAGGGTIKLKVNTELVNSGIIIANGITAGDTGGGGAGGGIMIELTALSGGGTINADGGTGVPIYYAGGGGGGRIALYYANNAGFNLANNVTAYGGGGTPGGAGTIYISDIDTTGNNVLKVDNNGRNGAETWQSQDTVQIDQLLLNSYGKFVVKSGATLDTSSMSTISSGLTGSYLYNEGTIKVNPNLTLSSINFYQKNTATLQDLSDLTLGNTATLEMVGYSVSSPLAFQNLTIQNGGNLTHSANTTTQANVVSLQLANLTIDSGGKIDLTGKGYSTNTAYSGTLNSGAGHGGSGGNSSTGVSGAQYDTTMDPVEIGSRGFNGSAGGGLVKMIVSGTTTNNGEITVDSSTAAVNTGGGSGGTILLSTSALSGAGHFNANGGNTTGTGGSGAGGRIAVFYANNSGYTGNVPANLTYFDGGTGGANAGGQGTFYLGTPDHYRITGSAIQNAGDSQTINIALIDNNGNPFVYDGDRTFVFSGANVSPSGNKPTCTDKNGNAIEFGYPTTLTLVNGTTSCDLVLYKTEVAEIETTDGVYNTSGDQSYDLDITVSSGLSADPLKSEIAVSPSPADLSLPDTIYPIATLKDTSGNFMTAGGATVTMTVAGVNPQTLSVTDNGNGTYGASYIPAVIGEDLITATVGGVAIAQDTDGTSDGTFHEFILNGAHANHFEITGNATQTAGTSQTITITAKDNSGTIDPTYIGLHDVTFSGANISSNGTSPTMRNENGIDINFGSTTQINFVNGVATAVMKLYAAQVAEIEATDGLLNTSSSQTYDLDVTVSESSLSNASISTSVNPIDITNPNLLDITVATLDQFGNSLPVGGATITLNVAGANSATPNITDNNNGTYTATYAPTIAGEDLITGTVNSENISHDTDGTDDGTFHETVTTVIANHLEITGNNNQIAGTMQTITISARDGAGAMSTVYSGDKSITLTGASIGTDGTHPTCTDKDGSPIELGSATTMTFIQGVATCDLISYKTEVSEIEATDGTMTTQGSEDFDLNVNVVAGSLDNATISTDANPISITTPSSLEITVTTQDQFDNSLAIGGATIVLNVSGANSATPTVTDNNDGTYSASYAPTIAGEDLITGTVNTINILHDTDGTDDGIFHETVTTEEEEVVVTPDCDTLEITSAKDDELVFDICITKNQDKSVAIKDDQGTGLSELKLKAGDKNLKGSLSIKYKKDKPSNLDEVYTTSEYLPYVYLKITPDFNDEAFNEAQMYFDIKNSWLAENQIEETYFLRTKSDKTKKAEFKLIDTKGTNANYRVTTDKLETYWTILGQKAIPIIVEPKIEEPEIIVPEIVVSEDPEIVVEDDEIETGSDSVDVVAPIIVPVKTPQGPIQKLKKQTEKIVAAVKEDEIVAKSAVGLAAVTVASMLGNIGSLAKIPLVAKDGTLQLLGINTYRRRKKRWGLIYDAQTGKPLSMATVIIRGADGKIKESRVTDQYGSYFFLAAEGSYTLEVEKDGYQMIAQQAEMEQAKTYYDNIYLQNQAVVMNQGNDVVALNVPLRKADQIIKQNFFNGAFVSMILGALFYLGLVLSIVAAIVNPISYNYSVVLIYGALSVFRSGIFHKPRWSETVNADGKPEPFAVVKVYDNTQKLVARTIADEKGRFMLVLDRGQYQMKVVSSYNQKATELEFFLPSRKSVGKKLVLG